MLEKEKKGTWQNEAGSHGILVRLRNELDVYQSTVVVYRLILCVVVVEYEQLQPCLEQARVQLWHIQRGAKRPGGTLTPPKPASPAHYRGSSLRYTSIKSSRDSPLSLRHGRPPGLHDPV